MFWFHWIIIGNKQISVSIICLTKYARITYQKFIAIELRWKSNGVNTTRYIVYAIMSPATFFFCKVSVSKIWSILAVFKLAHQRGSHYFSTKTSPKRRGCPNPPMARNSQKIGLFWSIFIKISRSLHIFSRWINVFNFSKKIKFFSIGINVLEKLWDISKYVYF